MRVLSPSTDTQAVQHTACVCEPLPDLRRFEFGLSYQHFKLFSVGIWDVVVFEEPVLKKVHKSTEVKDCKHDISASAAQILQICNRTFMRDCVKEACSWHFGVCM